MPAGRAARKRGAPEDGERDEERRGDGSACKQPCVESFHEPPSSSLSLDTTCCARTYPFAGSRGAGISLRATPRIFPEVISGSRGFMYGVRKANVRRAAPLARRFR